MEVIHQHDNAKAYSEKQAQEKNKMGNRHLF